MKQGLIAVIDDDELDMHIYKKIVMLTCPSYRFVGFSNGIDALNYLQKNSNNAAALPDLLLLDVRMPFLNGWQYLEKYCDLKPDLAKATCHYVCSASIDPFDLEFKNSNLHGYFMKPVSPKNILEIIKKSEHFHEVRS
ncbi:MAG TPA: response regulator [Cytophagaceae bacterium]|jgi:CheY-like chemotaxis protein